MDALWADLAETLPDELIHDVNPFEAHGALAAHLAPDLDDSDHSSESGVDPSCNPWSALAVEIDPDNYH